MLEKEKDKANLGGCLSDEMGLGKVGGHSVHSALSN
jgi:hypothetical protein